MSIQCRIFRFVCFVAALFIFILLAAPTHAQTIPSAPANYPPDPPSEIDWSGSPNSWDGIMASFNNARVQESRMFGTSLPPFVFPTFDSWQAMSSGEKTLWFINQERIARELEPMQGLEKNVSEVAQTYAEWMLTNNKFGHDAGGGNPWDRMYANPAIGSCHDFIGIGENLQYHATSGPDPVPFVIEKSVYVMMYMDAGSEWGHRHAFLWTPYTENSGDPNQEGFLGVGHAHGPFVSPTNGKLYQNTDMIVMDFFDPCTTWDEIVQAVPQPTPTATPSPTPTAIQSPPSPTPSPTPILRRASRIASGKVMTSAGKPSGLAGVTITSDDGQTTQSAQDGTFTLTGLSPAQHTLTPSKKGYVFSPPSLVVDLAAGDLSNIAFTDVSGPAGEGGNFALRLPLIRPH